MYYKNERYINTLTFTFSLPLPQILASVSCDVSVYSPSFTYCPEMVKCSSYLPVSKSQFHKKVDIAPLQCALNTAACLVTGTRKFDHGLSHLLHDDSERIHYKLGVTVHHCLLYPAPEYLVDCCTPVSDIPSRRHLWSVSHSTSPDRTTLLAQHFWSSGLLCCRSHGQELTTGQSPQLALSNNSFRQSLKTKSLPLSTHSAVEMLHDSALYKSIIDIDIVLLTIDVFLFVSVLIKSTLDKSRYRSAAAGPVLLVPPVKFVGNGRMSLEASRASSG